MSRKKIYYPESQIEKGLFTKGGEWMTVEGKEYIGFYHKYITGEVFSLSEYNKDLSEKLIPLDTNRIEPDVIIYDSNNNINNNQFELLKYREPRVMKREITNEDIKNGYITRYFIKKRNDRTSDIIEISKEDYSTLNQLGTGIDGFLYKGIEMKWRITGSIEDYEKNGILILGVRNSNKKMAFSKEREMRGITNFLGDFLEFYQK